MIRPGLRFCILGLFVMQLQASEESSPLPTCLAESTQCVLVVARGWAASKAKVLLLERGTVVEAWRRVDVKATIARIGGRGLAPAPGQDWSGENLPRPKREGDSAAPAGAFPIGHAFGFKPEDAGLSRMPFLRIHPDTVAVDDPLSPYYNRIVHETSMGTEPLWRSAEKMAQIKMYRNGLIVEYNTSPVVPSAGSCIFIHCWEAPGKETSGCTALAESDVLTLLRWLDPERKPILLQLPEDQYHSRKVRWKLPEITEKQP